MARKQNEIDAAACSKGADLPQPAKASNRIEIEARQRTLNIESTE